MCIYNQWTGLLGSPFHLEVNFIGVVSNTWTTDTCKHRPVNTSFCVVKGQSEIKHFLNMPYNYTGKAFPTLTIIMMLLGLFSGGNGKSTTLKF